MVKVLFQKEELNPPSGFALGEHPCLADLAVVHDDYAARLQMGSEVCHHLVLQRTITFIEHQEPVFTTSIRGSLGYQVLR